MHRFRPPPAAFADQVLAVVGGCAWPQLPAILQYFSFDTFPMLVPTPGPAAGSPTPFFDVANFFPYPPIYVPIHLLCVCIKIVSSNRLENLH